MNGARWQNKAAAAVVVLQTCFAAHPQTMARSPDFLCDLARMLIPPRHCELPTHSGARRGQLQRLFLRPFGAAGRNGA
jgi:hypothetical protein